MPTIEQLFQTVQADQNAANSAAVDMAQKLTAMMTVEAAYQMALTIMIMAENSGNQQQIDMAANALASANSAALAAESAYDAAFTVWQTADAKLQADRAALSAALQGQGSTKKKVT